MSFRRAFNKKDVSEVDWLIVGLGNPGVSYEITRHNAGFMCIDALAEKYRASVSLKKFNALCGECEINGKKCLLVKPQTYMNNSGASVAVFAKHYGIEPKNVLVISDDVSFDVGKIRVRRNGSSGGQNGLNSIIAKLQSKEFPRIKIGVGKKPEGWDMADWVLSNFKLDELDNLKPVLEKAVEAVPYVLEDDIDTAMQKFN
ncbi:MAG: aminoacyl-tRNA hydrolase [Ruminococcaceae bacterium]|nr:aminoacyl-tRNA hydrolase [Oscillospiraceae bacterium]